MKNKFSDKDKLFLSVIGTLTGGIILLTISSVYRDSIAEKEIVELNQTIESLESEVKILESEVKILESELKEKTDALIDLGWEEEVKLDLCPVCDDKYVYTEETTTTSGDTVYYIECNKCQFIFGYYSSKSELINIWNSIDDK